MDRLDGNGTAEQQQDDGHEFCCGPGEQFVQAVGDLFFEVDPANTDPDDLLTALLPAVLAYGDARAALAARPSAGTETLRARIEALANRYESNGRTREALGVPAWPLNVARDLRAALDGER